MAHKYAVLGASGHTGRVVTEGLLKRGHEVRAVCLDRAGLEPLVRLGAKPYPVDLDHQVPALREAFAGVDAVYTPIPPHPKADNYLKFGDQVGENIVSALTQAGTKWVVNLSALGAELRHRTGVILGLHRQERRLDRIHGLNVLHLRPCFFMDELLAWIPAIPTKDRVGWLFMADLSLDLVATRDVGEKALDYLDELEFDGTNVLELVGPRAYRMTEIAELIGKAIGKPELAYQQVDEEAEYRALFAAGLARDPAALWIEMVHAINEGHVKHHGQPSRGETTLERWVAEIFVPAYRAAVH